MRDWVFVQDHPVRTLGRWSQAYRSQSVMLPVLPCELAQPGHRDEVEHIAVEEPFEEGKEEMKRHEDQDDGQRPRLDLMAPKARKRQLKTEEEDPDLNQDRHQEAGDGKPPPS